MTTRKIFAAGVIVSCMVFGPAFSQPTGGPYGPLRQTYEIPSDAAKIFYVSPNGDSTSSGENLSEPTTLEAAIAKVKTGDAIIMRGGTYRTGDLVLNQGITIQPYKDEEPVLKGSFVASDWRSLGNGLWVTHWTRLFPSKPDGWWQREREGKKTPLYRFNNDMVFVDGKFLQAVGWEGEVDENSYYIDYDAGMVYIGTDPANHLVEITAFNVAILRTTGECHGKESDRKGYTIKGVTFTQYAYRALEIEGTEPSGISAESEHGKAVVGTLLENCTISFCSRVAGYFRGDRFTMRHCKVSDTSTEGVYVIGSNDILLEGNIFTRNNIERITGYYPAAVKIFNQCYRATCRDNLIIDLPYSNGIWYDVGEVDGVFVNNWVENVGHVAATTPTDQVWPSDNGFFFEISKGVIVAGNVFVNCDHGMMILNSSNARVYQNTFVNSMAVFGRNGRVPAGDHFGWHSSTGPEVEKREGHIFVNNLLYGDENFSRPLLFVWQPSSLCDRLPNPQLRELDNEVFVRARTNPSYPVILWSPAHNDKCQIGIDSLGTLRNIFPGSLRNSTYLAGYGSAVFKSADLGNYQLLDGTPGSTSGAVIPAEIRKAMGQSGKASRHVGALAPAE
ncbi:MAG TPA: right-handed parallel beta-helix repeat-containing protein [Bacteroidota bacterium]|nr:right-handed parallel beta-helix repeat-containing protein [Bacteroidota bacterium]